MIQLIKKYEEKLIRHGLATKDSIVIGGMDAEVVWNRDSSEITVLSNVINQMNINCILFARPAEPYFSILHYLTTVEHPTVISPEDCETRTFLHDIPIAKEFTTEEIVSHLNHRKSVLISGTGIVTYGVVSPEQAFVVFSSVCFSLYVKFFVDFYYTKSLNQNSHYYTIIKKTIESYGIFIDAFSSRPAMKGPLTVSENIIQAMAEAGRLTVESGMVDSFFGNISYKHDDVIYISQTGSSLDELEGYIDPCPIDGSSTTAITASSEFSAHKSVYELTTKNCILHGHPKFAVIMSMICDYMDCEHRDACFIKCDKNRFLQDIPIVPGEVGTGPTGLVNTLPPSLTGRGSIVYGHGLFTTGKDDFIEAFENLISIEKMCYQLYIEKVLLFS